MGSRVAPPQDLTVDLSGMSLSQVNVPSGREEEWRFTPLRRLRGLHALTSESTCTTAVYTGAVVASGSSSASSTFRAADRIAVAAQELARETAVIEIPAEAALDAPFVIGTVTDDVALGRVVVRAGAHSKATVISDRTGSGTLAETIEIQVGDGAALTFVTIADGDRDHVLAGQHHIRLGRDATVHHIAVTLGGDVVRLVTTVEYTAPGGSMDAMGVFFTDAGQHHEHRLFIDHSQPHCSSDVLYKGALQGDDAHAVWIGDVLIRAAATATRTYEMNRNLVLTDGARADSVPNLEIETGDVTSAGHASATGRFDEEQMFYLLARGIPLVEAKRLVVRGFINDIVQRIPSEEIRERLLHRVESRLGDHDPRFTFDEVAG